MNCFTKKDLRSGDIVVHRNGKVGIAIPEQNVITYIYDYINTKS